MLPARPRVRLGTCGRPLAVQQDSDRLHAGQRQDRSRGGTPRGTHARSRELPGGDSRRHPYGRRHCRTGPAQNPGRASRHHARCDGQPHDERSRRRGRDDPCGHPEAQAEDARRHAHRRTRADTRRGVRDRSREVHGLPRPELSSFGRRACGARSNENGRPLHFQGPGLAR